jgi:hypothetical protein
MTKNDKKQKTKTQKEENRFVFDQQDTRKAAGA